MSPSGSPLRLLLISPLPPPVGGIARWTRLVIDELEQRHDITLRHVDTRLRGRRITNNSLAPRILHGVRDAARAWWGVSRALLRGVDVAHLNTSGSLGLGRDIGTLLLCRTARVPVVLHLRFGRVPDIMAHPGLEAFALRVAFALSSTVVALESKTAEAVRRYTPGRRVEVIPNFAPAPEKAVSVERETVVLFVGHVTAAKGIDELLEAWNSITAVHPNWTLRVAGPAEDDTKRRLAEIRQLEYLGVLTSREVTTELQHAAIYVLPSHTEGFPNSLLEAMMSSSACIATAVGAMPDMLADDAGIIVAPGNVDQLTNALEYFVTSARERHRAGQHARARAMNLYTPAAVIPIYLALWRSLRR